MAPQAIPQEQDTKKRQNYLQVPNIFIEGYDDLSDTFRFGFLRFVRFLWKQRKKSFIGSIRKLGKLLKVARMTINRMVDAWVKFGLVTIEPGEDDTVQLIPQMEHIWANNTTAYGVTNCDSQSATTEEGVTICDEGVTKIDQPVTKRDTVSQAHAQNEAHKISNKIPEDTSLRSNADTSVSDTLPQRVYWDQTLLANLEALQAETEALYPFTPLSWALLSAELEQLGLSTGSEQVIPIRVTLEQVSSISPTLVETSTGPLLVRARKGTTAKETLRRETVRLEKNLLRAKNAQLPATLTIGQWLATLDYFDWKCAYCLTGPYDVLEHFIPITSDQSSPSYGGTTLTNCVPACPSCNLAKQERHSKSQTIRLAMERVHLYLESLSSTSTPTHPIAMPTSQVTSEVASQAVSDSEHMAMGSSAVLGCDHTEGEIHGESQVTKTHISGDGAITQQGAGDDGFYRQQTAVPVMSHHSGDWRDDSSTAVRTAENTQSQALGGGTHADDHLTGHPAYPGQFAALADAHCGDSRAHQGGIAGVGTSHVASLPGDGSVDPQAHPSLSLNSEEKGHRRPDEQRPSGEVPGKSVASSTRTQRGLEVDGTSPPQAQQAALQGKPSTKVKTDTLPSTHKTNGAGKSKKGGMTQTPLPAFTLSEQEQAFWQLWCAVWFNADIPPTLNDTAYGHVKKLAPHISTKEALEDLIRYARRELKDRGIEQKVIHLGNLVSSYSGWKQAAMAEHKAEEPPPKPTATPMMLELARKRALYARGGPIGKVTSPVS